MLIGSRTATVFTTALLAPLALSACGHEDRAHRPSRSDFAALRAFNRFPVFGLPPRSVGPLRDIAIDERGAKLFYGRRFCSSDDGCSFRISVTIDPLYSA